MNPIILENYITILRAGAFKSKDNEIIPMSLHKWHVLGKMAKEHHVQGFLSNGINHIKESRASNIPNITIVEQSDIAAEDANENFNASKAFLSYNSTKRKWEELREEEMSDIHNISDETLQLLDIIIMNADYTIDSMVNIEGVLLLGRFIRENKKAIDYTKLNKWLAMTKMVSMAEMLGTILIEFFDFSQDELPFMKTQVKNSNKIFTQTLEHTFRKQRTPLLTCLHLATFETLCHRFSRVISVVRDVEE
ncbi:MAG: hypothetical protein IKO58_03230 [Prevotella sp.]|nr:hypothetical protein [Prevotella sp.]